MNHPTTGLCEKAMNPNGGKVVVRRLSILPAIALLPTPEIKAHQSRQKITWGNLWDAIAAVECDRVSGWLVSFFAIEFGGVVSALSFSIAFWRECDCEVMGLSGEV
jgi:hypothetical protein